MNLPNSITLSRIASVPLLIWALSPKFPVHGTHGEQEIFASAIFILASITDGVDGYLAVLTAQTALYQSQQSLVTARMERLQNLVTLYQSLGGGWVEHTGEQPRPADAPVDYGAASAPVAASAATAG